MAAPLHPAIAAFVHPSTADVGRYAYMDVGGRAAPGACSREQRRSSCRSNYLPTHMAAPLHPATAAFVHPCTADVGNDCSYNPVAFTPSLEVRSADHAGAIICRPTWQLHCILQSLHLYIPVRQTWAMIVPTILLHLLHPWRSD